MNKKIIVVDDEEIALRNMSDELREHGWKVDAFLKPEDALQALENNEYDLGVFDIRMPGMTGVELLGKLRSLQKDVDVIFVTAYPSLETARDAVQLGATDYLIRPFELSELVRVVNRTLTYRELRLENQQLSNQLRQLYSLSQQVRLSETLYAIFEETLGHIVSALSPEFIYIAFLYSDGTADIIVHHGLQQTQLENIKEKMEKGENLICIQRGQPLRISDLDNYKYSPLIFLGIKSAVLAPISQRNKPVGAIVAGSKQKEAFSLADERFLVTTARLLGLIVERAKSAEALRRTEAELIEQQRQADKQLLEHYKEKISYLRDSAGGCAHELKNPLFIISGRAERLLKSVEAGSPLHEDLKVIEEQALRADELMNELLDFCYRTDLWVREILDVNILVKETLAAVELTGLPEGVELVSDLPIENLLIECDPLQFKRALKNLVDNAIRSAGSEGKVTVSSKADDNKVYVRVHNTGQAIPKDRWENIFAPFATTRPARRKGEPTGLGLAIARGILMSHRGTVKVEDSEESKGTTFLITIPLAEERREE